MTTTATATRNAIRALIVVGICGTSMPEADRTRPVGQVGWLDGPERERGSPRTGIMCRSWWGRRGRMQPISRVGPGDRVPGQPTPGVTREQAVSTDRMWGGFATTEPGMSSAWHHHGGFETTIYVLTGALRMEFGPGGRELVDARPGDFVYVGEHAVHRESNPSPEPATIVVVRSGEGEVVVNVEGPDDG
jgi:uncharacterized RmlC-like cupin family protein